RTTHTTSQPSATSRGVSCDPMAPVAPVTRIRFIPDVRRARARKPPPAREKIASPAQPAFTAKLVGRENFLSRYVHMVGAAGLPPPPPASPINPKNASGRPEADGRFPPPG